MNTMSDESALGRVRVSAGGESIECDRADALVHMDALYLKHNVQPIVVELTPPSPPVGSTAVQFIGGTPSVVRNATTLPAPPEPIRGVTVSEDGALRSSMDLLAAQAAGFAPKRPYYERGTMVIDIGVENARRSRVDHEKKPLVQEYCGEFIEAVEAEERVDVTIQNTDARLDNQGRLGLMGGNGVRYLVTEEAFPSLCNRLGFGGGSYLSKCWPALRSANFNEWQKKLQKDEGALNTEIAKFGAPPERDRIVLRLRKNKAAEKDAPKEIYGAVSTRYTSFDVNLVAEALMRAVPPDARGTVTYDGYKARFEVMFHADIQPEKYVAGEFFKAGVIIRTDDVGGGSLKGSAVIAQNLCLNLLCIDVASQPLFRLRHIGDVDALARKFREGFERALGKIEHFRRAWGYAVQDDVVKAAHAVNPEVPLTLSEAMPGLFNGILERELVLVKGRRETVVKDLVKMWEKDTSAAAGGTRGAVINAITRYAHEINEDRWAEDDIQQAAGALLYGKNGKAPAPFPYLPVESEDF